MPPPEVTTTPAAEIETAAAGLALPEHLESTRSILAAQLGAFLSGLASEESQKVREAVELLANGLTAGHTCVPTASLGGKTAEECLRRSGLAGDPGAFRPLIITPGGQLYFHLPFTQETRVAQRVASMARQGSAPSPTPPEEVANEYALLHPLQQDAVRKALTSQLSILTGGPGTGKTRTAACILWSVALAFERENGRLPTIRLAAPTGKAAARLTETLRTALARYEISPALRARLTTPATTLHRLLGPLPGTALFRHHNARPLDADIVLLDEVSMMPLDLFDKLLSALPTAARLLLLGDRDQLHSVEPGSVFGDLCEAGESSATGGHWLSRLTQSFRFQSGIGELARGVNSGDLATVTALLADPPAGVTLNELTGNDPHGSVLCLVREAAASYRAVAEANSVETALARFGSTRLLTALREGPWGCVSLNRAIEREIGAEGRHYHGRPILITRNDNNSGLFNGDLGLLWPDPAGVIRAWFESPTGGVRALPLERLPDHETAYAMTVHKSQGSEFETVHLVLPDWPAPVLNRSLLYTGVTRARSKLVLWYREPILRFALGQRVERHTGLAAAISAALLPPPAQTLP